MLSYLKANLPLPKNKNKKVNKTTLAAHKEALKRKGTSYASMDDFWADMKVDRHLSRLIKKPSSS